MHQMLLKIIILMFLQSIHAVPLQMLQFQGTMQPQPLNQEMNHQLLVQQLQRFTQQAQQQPGLMYQPTLVRPLQGTMQQQRLALEEQLFALQQFQALQRMNLAPTSTPMNSPPILVLLPNNESEVKDSDLSRLKLQNSEVGDDDTEIIDAELPEEMDNKKPPLRAFLLMPNTRSIIGDFISSIPFLPIEINVPDTISWIYNGIAGIIAGIGQNLPFRPQTQLPNGDSQNAENNIKSVWSNLKRNQQLPIVMIPLSH